MTLSLQNAEQTRLRVLKLITKEKTSRQQRHVSDLMSPSPSDLLLHWTTGPWSYECDYRGFCKQDGSQLGPYRVTLAYISSYEEGPGALEVGWSWGDNVTRYLRAIVRLSCIMEPRTMEAAESFLLCSGRGKKKSWAPSTSSKARQMRARGRVWKPSAFIGMLMDLEDIYLQGYNRAQIQQWLSVILPKRGERSIVGHFMDRKETNYWKLEGSGRQI